MVAYESPAGTSYTAEIETPSGLTFHAEIYVPRDAEYADMNELAEVASYGVSKMLGSHIRGHEPQEARVLCGDQPTSPIDGALLPFACVLDPGHLPAEWHQGPNGERWGPVAARWATPGVET